MKTLKEYQAQDTANRAEREARIKEHWKTLVIKNVEDIPQLPVPLTDFHYDKLYEAGVLRKEELEDGAAYTGRCRNAGEAVWHAEKNCFTYTRHKWGGSFPEDINHLADDDGHDLFVPWKKVE
jgi:hypothetical protein